jgi:hypothetical protein
LCGVAGCAFDQKIAGGVERIGEAFEGVTAGA